MYLNRHRIIHKNITRVILSDPPLIEREILHPLAIPRQISLSQRTNITPAVVITPARELIAGALVIVCCTFRIATATIPHHPKLPPHLSGRIMSMNANPIDTRNGSRCPLFLYTLAPTPNVLLALALVAGSRQVGNPRASTP